jgi:hypothetical protein
MLVPHLENRKLPTELSNGPEFECGKSQGRRLVSKSFEHIIDHFFLALHVFLFCPFAVVLTKGNSYGDVHLRIGIVWFSKFQDWSVLRVKGAASFSALHLVSPCEADFVSVPRL